ncbi:MULTISPECIES: M3 family oligoendopeptidase [unclassified Nodosilinea]|uniref:M3 family oligoendopeptidase n=1 Tax=Leptolyngbya subtilissima DQ-A4 TaxID=2933933 RepID=A0ABV0K8L1_9CYAN|nr:MULTISPECIES: M3 family oligoendopeptidase [unclassified Nodosilinea]MBD2108154.1 M3 family oligoendopeptidase [Nodosilinea sp. FACHB-13]MBD2110244.1 M3 family oligoendopeptidase [Nodosilinea sp. FACHB-141]
MPILHQTWDNSHFFAGSDDPQIAATVERIKAEIDTLSTLCAPFIEHIEPAEPLTQEKFEGLLAQVRAAHQQRTATAKRLGNLRTFISSILSVDSRDASASEWKPTLQQLGAEISQATKALDIFLLRVDNAFIQALIADPVLEELSFSLLHQRQLNDQLLSLAEEKLITGLAVNGLQGWGNLYTELSGTLQCTVAGDTVGLAKAFNLLSSPDRTLRSEAWHGVNAAWESRAETVATVLNAINGWRLEETKQRSRHRSLHYLDKSCHQSRIDRTTLDAMMEATYQRRSLGQRALTAMGKVLKIEPMAPWDLFAPPPAADQSGGFAFEAAIELVADAFRQFSPAMGDFAMMMAEKGWIDAQPTPNRATGAYCTSFAEPKEPRIFMTFEGSMNNVLTLAHELGHAWHNWVMQDLPRYKTFYPMTLAETASIFGETLVRDALFEQASTPEQKLKIAWEEGSAAATFLLNIPARFTFEQKLVESRKQGFVIADNLKTMMRDSWQHWYEDSLASYDDMFWASKLHFSIAELGFYNYPYLFGYLFSLGIYAQKDQYGAQFNDLYTKLLRDTGSMTAEDVVLRHLQQDIRQPEFWQDSLDIVDRAVSRLESLVV